MIAVPGWMSPLVAVIISGAVAGVLFDAFHRPLGPQNTKRADASPTIEPGTESSVPKAHAASPPRAPPGPLVWIRAHRIVLVLALAAGLLLWGTRFVVRDCSPQGCVLVNRWTGSVTFQRATRLPAR